MEVRTKNSLFVCVAATMGLMLLSGCGLIDLSGLLGQIIDSDGDAIVADPNINDSSAENTGPVASAGSDMAVSIGDEVVLDASATTDVDGDRLTFSWLQIDGTPAIQLSNGFSSAARFFAPELSSATTLTFRLTVSDRFRTSTDEVTVTINP